MSTSNLKYNVKQSWGVGSLRLCAGFPGSLILDGKNTTYVLPLGSQIVFWDIETRQRKLSFQAHSDLIICLLYNAHYQIVITMSYRGEIKLWDREMNVLFSSKTTFGNAHYGSWSSQGHRFVVCGGPSDQSLVAVYELCKDNEKEVNLNMLWSHTGAPAINTPSSAQNKDSVTYTNQHDGYVIAQFNSHGNIIAVYERYHGNPSEVHLLDAGGKLVKSEILDPLGNPKSSVMCTIPSSNGFFAIGFQGGLFTVVSEYDLKIKAIFQATGSPQVAIWDRENILAISYLSGIMSWWTPSGELIREVVGAPKDSVMHLNWVPTGPCKALWVGGIMSLSYIEFEYSNSDKYPSKVNEKYSLKYHEVTGCGFDLNRDNLAASGDFAGNVLVWSKRDNNPLYKFQYSASIRCLSWNGNTLYIGALDGCVLKWCPSQSNDVDMCLVCASGVISLCWSHDHLAVGLDNGYLLVYEFSEKEHISDPLEKLNIRAHYLERDNAVVPAEVWCVCWSPCSAMIATASEDHTTCIWDGKTGKKLHTLHGHTTAVTCVDWKIFKNGNNTLATCADDRSVRIYNATNFNIVHIFKLENIIGWFTLTYLSLNPVCQQCLCSTQNGHLALWDCMSGELLLCLKMHCGSIEGLAWSHDFKEFGTVSSDCIVNIFSVD